MRRSWMTIALIVSLVLNLADNPKPSASNMTRRDIRKSVLGIMKSKSRYSYSKDTVAASLR